MRYIDILTVIYLLGFKKIVVYGGFLILNLLFTTITLFSLF